MAGMSFHSPCVDETVPEHGQAADKLRTVKDILWMESGSPILQSNELVALVKREFIQKQMPGLSFQSGQDR